MKKPDKRYTSDNDNNLGQIMIQGQFSWIFGFVMFVISILMIPPIIVGSITKNRWMIPVFSVLFIIMLICGIILSVKSVKYDVVADFKLQTLTVTSYNSPIYRCFLCERRVIEYKYPFKDLGGILTYGEGNKFGLKIVKTNEEVKTFVSILNAEEANRLAGAVNTYLSSTFINPLLQSSLVHSVLGTVSSDNIKQNQLRLPMAQPAADLSHDVRITTEMVTLDT